jgi:hypothetical protein
MTLQVSARLLVWPPVCCRCGTPTGSTRPVSCGRATSRGYEVKTWQAPCCERCLSLPAAVEVVTWSGTVWTFRFHQPDYARLFAQANATKLLGGACGSAPL